MVVTVGGLSSTAGSKRDGKDVGVRVRRSVLSLSESFC